jgi:hypothetical protein
MFPGLSNGHAIAIENQDSLLLRRRCRGVVDLSAGKNLSKLAAFFLQIVGDFHLTKGFF